MGRRWLPREEELFKDAWNDIENYDDEDLPRVFNRTWKSLEVKARSMGLTTRAQLKAEAQLKQIEHAIKMVTV